MNVFPVRLANFQKKEEIKKKKLANFQRKQKKEEKEIGKFSGIEIDIFFFFPSSNESSLNIFRMLQMKLL